MHTDGVPPEPTSLATLIRESLRGEYELRIRIGPPRGPMGRDPSRWSIEIQALADDTQYANSLGYVRGWVEWPYHLLAERVNDVAAEVLCALDSRPAADQPHTHEGDQEG